MNLYERSSNFWHSIYITVPYISLKIVVFQAELAMALERRTFKKKQPAFQQFKLFFWDDHLKTQMVLKFSID